MDLQFVKVCAKWLTFVRSRVNGLDQLVVTFLASTQNEFPKIRASTPEWGFSAFSTQYLDGQLMLHGNSIPFAKNSTVFIKDTIHLYINIIAEYIQRKGPR